MSDEKKIIDYASASPPIPWYRRPLSLIELLLAVLAVAVIVQLLTPTITRHPHKGDYTGTRCLSNMRSLGQMIYLYTSGHKSYPDSLATLAGDSDEANQDLFCCSPLGRKSVPRATTQPFVDFINDPSSESYLYLAPGESPHPNQILLVERTATHNVPTPANIVLFDGTARSISAAQHQRILQQINAGQTKIMLPP